MAQINITEIDAAFIKIDAEPSILQELREYFTFKVPGAEFHPSVRNHFWDGKIRLLDTRKKTLYAGLKDELLKVSKEMGYTSEYTPKFERTTFTEEDLLARAREVGLTLDIRPYQVTAILNALNSSRQLMLSPTASGKSMIIYMICRMLERKTLIIVPTTALVEQMTSDFADYGYDSDANVHKIYYGKDRQTNKMVTVTTWQTLAKQPEEYFKQFEVVIGDECHLFAAKSLVKIMEALTNTWYRIGATGSLDGTKTHEMVIQGLFGPISRVATTRELMDKGYLAELDIKCLVLTHSQEDAKKVRPMTYQEEIEFLFTMPKRNDFIVDLVTQMKGNVLVLCQYVDKHAIPLHELMKQKVTKDRNVYLIIGKVDPEEREKIRKILETETDAILVASIKSFATGSNVKNIRHVVFTAPTKSMVTTLQSIGRAIRKSPTKTKATLHDIADNLTYRGRKNFAQEHFLKRLQIYAVEKFPYKIFNIGLNKDE